MAKSIRSKWKRKCRAVKRERYGKKELERLKKTLGIDDKNTDVNMTEISEIATVTDGKTLQQTRDIEVNEEMIMDTAGKRVYNSRSMRDQNGTYPVWMHQRRIRKHRNAEKRKKKKIGKNRK